MTIFDALVQIQGNYSQIVIYDVNANCFHIMNSLDCFTKVSNIIIEDNQITFTADNMTYYAIAETDTITTLNKYK